MSAPLKADKPSARGWFFALARPSLLWFTALAVPVAAWRGNLSDTSFWALCVLAGFLFAFRGGVDKDGVARLLKIWKGSGI